VPKRRAQSVNSTELTSAVAYARAAARSASITAGAGVRVAIGSGLAGPVVAVAAEAGTPVETEGAADDIPEPQAANKSAAIIASGVRPACMFTSAII
jgi:hypothetical protein